MEFTNCLPVDCYEGIIEGILIKWTTAAKARLPNDAILFKKDVGKMKAATEHVALASAQRLQKHTVRIIGSFHKFTIASKNGEKVPDKPHCTVSMRPGDPHIHIYTNIHPTLPIEDMEVLAETVVLPGQRRVDPTLSMATQAWFDELNKRNE